MIGTAFGQRHRQTHSTNVSAPTTAGTCRRRALGADTMIGGLGNEPTSSTMRRPGGPSWQGGGIDTVRSSISYVIGDNFENLTLIGKLDLRPPATRQNVITATYAGKHPRRWPRRDTMYGGAGSDTYIVDNAGDCGERDQRAGIDTV